jgi:predicted metal-dependent hydrolase
VNLPPEVVRHPRARRAKLSVDPASGRVRLVLPPRAPLKSALVWAEAHGDWIAAQRAALPEARPFVDGATVPCDGRDLTICWREGGPRTVTVEDDRLMTGGPQDNLPRRIETWLKREALRILAVETADVAKRAGVSVERVSVGDPRGRWGSCAASGAIRYSWRLILAPRAVRQATVAHEVAHRVHMNHGAAFHALVADLYGRDPTPERRWLKANGATLHWFGRSSPA